MDNLKFRAKLKKIGDSHFILVPSKLIKTNNLYDSILEISILEIKNLICPVCNTIITMKPSQIELRCPVCENDI